MQKVTALFLAALLTLSGSVVRAQDQSVLILNDSQISEIRNNCLAAQSILERIHSSDALARFNLGQQYEVIAKHMAAMNSRIAQNQLDSVDLTQTTVDFSKQRDLFISDYVQYEQTMSRAIKLTCVDQPIAFYDTIILAREHRATVRASVDKLSEFATRYAQQFSDFRKATLSTKGSAS